MNSILLGKLLLYLAIALLVWQLTKIKKDFITSQIEVKDLNNRVKAQEDHLKATLNIMQDLAKKMHIQQEVLDKTTVKLSQIELHNAELIQALQKKIPL